VNPRNLCETHHTPGLPPYFGFDEGALGKRLMQ
jgi:hypothetical protein